jgi:hypothetical protein
MNVLMLIKYTRRTICVYVKVPTALLCDSIKNAKMMLLYFVEIGMIYWDTNIY